jgi:hypothetical protein
LSESEFTELLNFQDEAVSKVLNLKNTQNNIWSCDLRVFFAACGKKSTTKYAKKAQSNTEFLLCEIKFCSVHYDFIFDTASSINGEALLNAFEKTMIL